MSYYDPYHLFTRQQRNTHTGQIIRKKPYYSYSPALSPEDFESAEKLLENQGYIVYPPGYTPPTPTPTLIPYSKTGTWKIDVGNITYVNNGEYSNTVHLAPLWLTVNHHFDLSYDSEEISDFSFYITLNSFSMGGASTQPAGTFNNQWTFAMQPNYPTTVIGGSSAVNQNTLSEFGITLSSTNDDTLYLLQADGIRPIGATTGFHLFSKGNRWQEAPCLNYYVSHDPMIYNKLKANDARWLLENIPTLMVWRYSGNLPSGEESFDVDHHIITFTVSLSYNHF